MVSLKVARAVPHTFVTLYETVMIPADIEVTVPVAGSIAPTAELSLVQVPPVIASDKVTGEPLQVYDCPEMLPASG